MCGIIMHIVNMTCYDELEVIVWWWGLLTWWILRSWIVHLGIWRIDVLVLKLPMKNYDRSKDSE